MTAPVVPVTLWDCACLSVVLVSVFTAVRVGVRIRRYGLRLSSRSPWFWCSCVCARIRRYGLRLCFRSPWFWCSCVCVRIRRYGQGLHSRSPWLVVVFIAVFGYGDVGKDCACALLGFGARVHSCRGAETAPLVCLFS